MIEELIIQYWLIQLVASFPHYDCVCRNRPAPCAAPRNAQAQSLSWIMVFYWPTLSFQPQMRGMRPSLFSPWNILTFLCVKRTQLKGRSRLLLESLYVFYLILRSPFGWDQHLNKKRHSLILHVLHYETQVWYVFTYAHKSFRTSEIEGSTLAKLVKPAIHFITVYILINLIILAEKYVRISVLHFQIYRPSINFKCAPLYVPTSL